MNVKHKARVLILDDEADLRSILSDMLCEHFTDVIAVGTYDEAIQELKKHSYDVIISDFKVNGKTGLDLRNWQRENQPNCQFILLTGYSSDPALIEYLKFDHFKILQKPAHPNELIFPLKRDFPKKSAA